MSSQNASTPRRIPKQDRAENRIRQMLATTEKLIGESGLESVTMTEIAATAGMSIGALYQYFPNKDAIASAMRTAYAQEMDRLWSDFLKRDGECDLLSFSDGIVDLMTKFISAHPAYLMLFSAAVKSERSDLEREGLRKRFAVAFILRCPTLADAEAVCIAEMALAMVKSLIGVTMNAQPTGRKLLEKEMKIALFSYLSQRLGTGQSE